MVHIVLGQRSQEMDDCLEFLTGGAVLFWSMGVGIC